MDVLDELAADQLAGLAALTATLRDREVAGDPGEPEPAPVPRTRRRDVPPGSVNRRAPLPRTAGGRAAPPGREVDSAGRLVPVVVAGVARRRGRVPARLLDTLDAGD